MREIFSQHSSTHHTSSGSQPTEIVFSKIKHHLATTNNSSRFNNNKRSHNTNNNKPTSESQRSVARSIIAFLQLEYDLHTNVSIQSFVTNQTAETNKAQLQLAIATQRAAAFFSLQVSLLQSTLHELNKQIELTKESRSWNYSNELHAKLFVEPLEHEAATLNAQLVAAEQNQHYTQRRFDELRQQATKPLIEQLQISSKAYANLYKRMDPTDLCVQVERLKALLTVVGKVQQHVSPPPGPTTPTTTTTTITSQQQQQQQQQHQQQQHQVGAEPHSLTYLQVLYREAHEACALLHTVLTTVQQMCNEHHNIHLVVEMGEIKSVERTMEKAVESYNGDFSRVVDLVRGTRVCKDIPDAAATINALANVIKNSQDVSNDQQNQFPKVEILRVKNRLDRMFAAASETGGYRDILMNIRLNKRHVCEVQIQLEPFLQLKTGGRHDIYSVARSLHLLDPELSHVHIVQQVSSSANNDNEALSQSIATATTVDETPIREEFQLALERVCNGTCQSIHLTYYKPTISECSALRNALLHPSCFVREIMLAECAIDERKAKSLSCEGVETRKLGEFRIVDLGANKGIGGECVVAFVSEELEKFSVRECELGATDAERIAKALIDSVPYRLIYTVQLTILAERIEFLKIIIW